MLRHRRIISIKKLYNFRTIINTPQPPEINRNLATFPVVSSLRRALDSVIVYYEECIGLSEVHKARSDVTLCEEKLNLAQVARRQKQTEIQQIQIRLKDIHKELDRTTRGDDKYLDLLTEAHEAVKEEKSLLSAFEELEMREREALQSLSNKVRVSHEREREREERTKYWSLTGSLVGALLGIFGTTIANELRMRHLRDMLPTTQHVRPILDEMVQLIRSEQTQVAKFITDLKDTFGLESPKLLASLSARSTEQHNIEQENGDKIVEVFRQQNKLLSTQMDELKRLIALGHAANAGDVDPKSVVYVGSEMEDMLRQTERNLESRMKLQTLVAVVGTYTVICLTLPLLYFYFTNG